MENKASYHIEQMFDIQVDKGARANVLCAVQRVRDLLLCRQWWDMQTRQRALHAVESE